MEVYDWTIPIIIILSILICCFIMSPIFHVKNSENKNEKKRHAPFEFIKLRKGWLYSGLIALVVEYVLILLSFAATALAIYILVENKDPDTAKSKIIIYSVLSLMFSLFNTIFKPKKLATGYRQAYNLLNEAILEYEYPPAAGSNIVKPVDPDDSPVNAADDPYKNMKKAIYTGEKYITTGADL